MSWASHNSLKLARLLKTTSPNTILARQSWPARRHSSGLVDALKSVTTAPLNHSGDVNSTLLPGKNTTPGAAGSPNASGSSVWGDVMTHLVKANETARLQVYGVSNDPPDIAWKKRSDSIAGELRKAGTDSYGPRPSTNLQARRVKGPTRNDSVGLNDAEVPVVSSGRTVTSTDFGRAIVRLNQILQRNRVRQEWRRDKYFTKPTELRYQLRSRRHRQRFAAAIRRKVQIVQAIQRRGM